MKLYRILMDSVKLFFMNVFMYAIFLELYIFMYLIQTRFNVTLPSFEMFYAGVATFIAITVWMYVSVVWSKKIKDQKALLTRAFVSEVPFILLLLILWLISFSSASARELYGVMVVFSWYMILFPLVMLAAKQHKDAINISHFS